MGRVIFRIAVIIGVVEILIMLAMVNIPVDIDHGEVLIKNIGLLAIFDAILLVAFSSPLIYLWVVKPYVRERNDALEKVTRLAHYDPLTRLANRRLINQNLNRLIARCIRREIYGALLLIDLDKFKPINDDHGHDAGDAILAEIAKRLVSAMRDEDLVGRIGGDEYVILIDELDENEHLAIEKVNLIADKLRGIIKAPLEFNGRTLQVDCSIGISIFGDENITMNMVLKRADIAMYQAKKTIGKHVVFSTPI